MATDEGATGAPPVTVMSFNIRYGTAKDGDNHWDKRNALCASRVMHFNPDILGLQETLDFQNDYLLQSCPGYTAVGFARDDGKLKGEFSTIFYAPHALPLLSLEHSG